MKIFFPQKSVTIIKMLINIAVKIKKIYKGKELSKVKLFIVVLLFIINIGTVIHYYQLKQGYHVDELFSYGHANSSDGAYLVKGVVSNINPYDVDKYLLNRWWSSSIFHNYLTVQKEEQFHYKHIFENLKVGVHPPLFYILLHTICSFFPDIFSKWQGAILNILVWIILLVMMYKLSGRFFSDKYLALFPVIFYAFSQVGFNTVLYIRGYLMQTLWAVCLMYEVTVILQEKDVKKKHWFLIFLYSLLGMLTQYNSIIYSAIVGIIAGSVLLIKKRYKHIIYLALCMILSLCTLLIAYPEAISVFKHSSRADEVVSRTKNILNMISYIFMGMRHWKFSDIYMTELWSFHRAYSMIEIIILMLFYKYHYTKARRDIDLIAVIGLLMCLFAAICMPQMYIYSTRYVMLIIPLIAIVTIWYINFIVQQILSNKKITKIILCLIIAINTAFAGFNDRSPYAFQYKDDIKENIKGKNVIWIVPDAIMFYEGAEKLQNAENAYMTYSDSIIDLKELNRADYLVNFNLDARFSMELKPNTVALLPRYLAEKLGYIKTVKVGERFYDLYYVRKFQIENEEKNI